jgi:Tfp pilus assembly protein PilN
MIKVNLIGTAKKKPAKAARQVALPATVTPILLVLVMLGFLFAGYSWYSSLTSEAAGLADQVTKLEARRAELEAVIKQDQIYEARKKMLESRVKIIDGLQKNQVSPVIALDQLAEAVERTQFVWLSSLDQRDAVLTMNGVGTSLTAIADFYTNLNATGYFKNIDLGPSQESSGNFTFSLKCEFAPPRSAASNLSIPAPAAGGN